MPSLLKYKIVLPLTLVGCVVLSSCSQEPELPEIKLSIPPSPHGFSKDFFDAIHTREQSEILKHGDSREKISSTKQLREALDRYFVMDDKTKAKEVMDKYLPIYKKSHACYQLCYCCDTTVLCFFDKKGKLMTMVPVQFIEAADNNQYPRPTFISIDSEKYQDMMIRIKWKQAGDDEAWYEPTITSITTADARYESLPGKEIEGVKFGFDLSATRKLVLDFKDLSYSVSENQNGWVEQERGTFICM